MKHRRALFEPLVKDEGATLQDGKMSEVAASTASKGGRYMKGQSEPSKMRAPSNVHENAEDGLTLLI